QCLPFPFGSIIRRIGPAAPPFRLLPQRFLRSFHCLKVEPQPQPDALQTEIAQIVYASVLRIGDLLAEDPRLKLMPKILALVLQSNLKIVAGAAEKRSPGKAELAIEPRLQPVRRIA